MEELTLGNQKNYLYSKGLPMKQVTLRAYAQMYKLSYFKVMKMVRNQELKSISVEENGKEVEYVVIDEVQNKKVEEAPLKPISLKEENKMLKKEVLRLKVELEKCNKRTILA
ncbi:MAG: Unknown protein [uncultured Sulfurovum sp.]|uniref:Uncharacterized protein n=1 Tax=uncultured Sulfurovum sp. TaxID=269237 RepID=A0A6S6TB49_9BACT|nr:MAG: Unknown protein [uncultured Sulfurovum sp.]